MLYASDCSFVILLNSLYIVLALTYSPPWTFISRWQHLLGEAVDWAAAWAAALAGRRQPAASLQRTAQPAGWHPHSR